MCLFPLPPLESSLLLSPLGLWIAAWLSFIAKIHLEMSAYHVCLSEPELSHSGCFFF